MASAKILADYTGRRLFVNWRSSKECNIEWEDLFVNTIERYPDSLSSFQAGINLYDDDTNTDRFHMDMPRSLICNNCDVVAVHACRNFQPEAMEREAYNSAKSLFYRSLQPVYDIEKTVNDMYKCHFTGNDIVGIHIRRTDHLSFMQKDPRLVCPTDMFIEVMENILKNNSQLKFFLATDDKEEEKRICHIFTDAIIVHQKESVNRDTKKGMQDALIDWLLLSKTSGIISSFSSSFSEEAAIVNMTKNDSLLRAEELSKTHYKMRFKAHLRTHWDILEGEGFVKYILYSYNYRKGQFLNWIRKRTSV